MSDFFDLRSFEMFKKKYYTEAKDVQYYADLLAIHPKQLNKIVREATHFIFFYANNPSPFRKISTIAIGTIHRSVKTKAGRNHCLIRF